RRFIQRKSPQTHPGLSVWEPADKERRSVEGHRNPRTPAPGSDEGIEPVSALRSRNTFMFFHHQLTFFPPCFFLLYSNRMEKRVHGARRRRWGCLPRERALLTERGG
uniref:Uncharacterized protein n=1 Tax=Gasterosteus aculeatus TaxID=69293 RepID=G3NJP9_GASAC